MAEKDRREFVRVNFGIQTTVRTKDRTLWSSSTLDISMNGLRLAAAEAPLPAGAACEIEICLSEADPPIIIEARGTVTRTEPGVIAVQFAEIDLDSYHHLQRLIVNNAPDADQAEEEIGTHWGIRPARRSSGS